MKLLFSLLLLFTSPCWAQNIVTTIKPLHSLVLNITGESAQVDLIVKNASPHSYQLKPSDIKTINQAEVIFYIDPSVESFITKAIQASASTNKFQHIYAAVESQAEDHPSASDHDDHDHGHTHDKEDAHIWLSIEKTREILNFITAVLSRHRPENSPIYQQNLQATLVKLDKLDAVLDQQLADVKQVNFIVQHNAYQHFEQAYALSNAGVLQINPAIPMSAKKLRNINKLIDNSNVKCIFSEPQFSNRAVKSIAAQANINTAELDPLGNLLPADQELYFNLLTNLADNFQTCLSS